MMLASKLFEASIWSEVGLRQGKSVTDSPATHSSVGPYSFRQPPLLAFSFYTHSWSTFTFQSKLVLPTGDQRSFQKPNVIKFFRETAPVQSYGRTQYPTAAPYPYRTATIYSQTRTTHCFLENRNWSWFHRSLSVNTFLRDRLFVFCHLTRKRFVRKYLKLDPSNYLFISSQKYT